MIAQTVHVCQNKACRKAGAAKVLAAFQTDLPAHVSVMGCQCLGQCGNGPMVLVMPEQVWYHRVQPDEVKVIVQRHLLKEQWVKAMLYPKFHAS